MGIFQRLFGRAEPKQQQRRPAMIVMRGFDAAKGDRLKSTWAVSGTSTDDDVYRGAEVVRRRARDHALNNTTAKKFLNMVSTNVVGPNGFRLQSLVADPTGTPDNLARKAIEDAFSRWSTRAGGCDVTGRRSFGDICRTLIRVAARDGEFLVRKVRGKQAGEFGFSLQLLAIDRLDIQLNKQLSGGSIIKMGVELNTYGKPVAYHVRQSNPVENSWVSSDGQRYERIPAEDIYHGFVTDDTEQTRGYSWMHAALVDTENLGGFKEAAIIAARVGASKMGFFTSPDGDAAPLADGIDDGGFFTEADPGQFGVLPPGYEFQSWNPDYPNTNFDPFVKACLRSIAAGLGVSYNSLSNDLENVNFSSIRSGVLEERDFWMTLQSWFIDAFLEDVFSEWLRMALLSGAIVLPNGATLPASKYDKFRAATWQGRRWQWVDPRADADANISLVNAALKSRRDVISEMGGDIDDTLAQIAQEQSDIERLKIQLGDPVAHAQINAQQAMAQQNQDASK